MKILITLLLILTALPTFAAPVDIHFDNERDYQRYIRYMRYELAMIGPFTVRVANSLSGLGFHEIAQKIIYKRIRDRQETNAVTLRYQERKGRAYEDKYTTGDNYETTRDVIFNSAYQQLGI